MIVDSMSIKEITKAVLSEKEYVTRCSLRFKENFKSVVLKTSHFPCIKTYKCTTPVNKTVYNISIRAEKRGEHSKPTHNIYTLYRRREGIYAVLIENNWTAVTIFPPHFFERYRTRILKDESIPIDSVINVFFSGFFGYCDMWVDNNNVQIFDKEESDTEEINIVGAFHEGLILGFHQDNYCMAITIVSFEQFKPDQWPQYNKLYNGFKELIGEEMWLRYMNSINRDTD